MTGPRVLLISPVRNEAPHIERVVTSVAAQTRPPAEWIVVDDGSTDRTLEILRSLEPQVPFLTVVEAPPQLTTAEADRLAAAAAPRAFNYGLSRAALSDFTHVGKLDGDTELPADYFARVLAEFERDPRLGIAGGIRLERKASGWRPLRIPRSHVPGALKLYSRACFEAIGGMRELLGWDAIDETYARMRGFETRSFAEIVTHHHRPWGVADGRLRGRRRYGHASYVAHQTPTWVALKAVKVACMPPVGLSGAAFLYGYAHAAVRGATRVDDDEFRRFVRRDLRKRLLRSLVPRRAT